ncbi:6-phosphogluconolactonase [Natronoflexus pectinivorans]|uniref:6-phosphogluconolactonase n=1 Tax=Natronoflexus pectinivorans TaxID=682526 RepID=A0A4V6NMP7_9BACT|nr:6-phosphogluconolactonase [Natronoflexus pectinivorans]TCO07312.1 6-phosphogluconolactonase [Natronoflexus pectinivorans]
MTPKIEIYPGKKAMAREFGKRLEQLTKESENITIALSGGSTPKAIFEILVLEFKDLINWKNIKFFWGDERCVEPIDPESNYGMTHDLLLSRVPVNKSKVFRVAGEINPSDAALQYEETIKNEVPFVNGLPQFDLMILGLGDDGHTASIFPHQIEFWESENICEVATHPDSGQNRVTLTGNVINNSKQILFWITGDKKAEKVDEIINKKDNYKQYPASLVKPENAIWMMDEKAARKIG